VAPVVRKVDPSPVDIVLWLDVVHEPHAVFEWTNPALGEVVPLHHACEIARGDEQTLKSVLNAGTCACVHVQRVSIRLQSTQTPKGYSTELMVIQMISPHLHMTHSTNGSTRYQLQSLKIKRI
jgi:hypothetical protein